MRVAVEIYRRRRGECFNHRTRLELRQTDDVIQNRTVFMYSGNIKRAHSSHQ